MPNRNPSHTTQRSRRNVRARNSTQPQRRRSNSPTQRTASPVGSSMKRSRTQAARSPVPQLTPTVRSELQTLSRRWKNLLPRLQESNGSAPAKRVRSRKRRRAATR